MHRLDRSFLRLFIITTTLLMTPPAILAGMSLPAIVSAVSVDGADLHATVRWLTAETPPTARVVVQDIRGDEVTSTFFTPSAAEPVDVTLFQALADVLEHGLQYRLVVEKELDGVALSNPLPISVRLQCSDAAACDFVVLAGLHHDSDTIVLSSELAQALDDAKGSKKGLFTAVLQAHPELISEVFSYAVELEVFENILAESGLAQPGSCTCHWSAILRSVGAPSCGLGQLIQAYAGGGQAQMTAIGSTELTMELQCLRTRRRTDGSTFSLPGGQTIEIPDRVTDVCGAGCSSNNIHALAYGAYTMAAGGPDASTAAHVTMDFTADGQPVGDATAAASKLLLDEITDEDWLLQRWQSAGTSAKIATNAQASAILPSSTYPGGSLSEAQFVLTTTGSSECVPGRFGVVTVIDRLCNAPEPVEIVLLSGEEEKGGDG